MYVARQAQLQIVARAVVRHLAPKLHLPQYIIDRHYYFCCRPSS